MEWFNNLNDEEKKYIERHPDPSHLVFYLKQGFSFYKSLLRGYEEHVLEEIELSINEGNEAEKKFKNNNKKLNDLT